MARKRSNETLPAKLKQAQIRFEQWRASRETRRIPEPLWHLAVGLAQDLGAHRTCSALRLNSETLKKRLQTPSRGARPMTPTDGPAFVEISPLPRANPPTEGSADFELGDGGRLRISWNGSMPDLVSLCRSLLGGGA